MNRKILRFFIIVLVIMIASSKSSYVYSQNTWQPHQLGNRAFEVLVPGEPEEQVQNITTASGVLTMHMYAYESPQGAENLVYMAMYVDYPPEQVSSDYKDKVPEFFRNAVNGAVNNVKGTLLSEKDVEINGYPGKQTQIVYQNGVIIINMLQYLVGSRTYILQVITLKEKQGNKSITKFFESFKPHCLAAARLYPRTAPRLSAAETRGKQILVFDEERCK